MMKTTLVVTAAFCLLAACGGETESVPATPAQNPTGAPATKSDQASPGASDSSLPQDPSGLSTQALSAAQCDYHVRCLSSGYESIIELWGGRDECIAFNEKDNQLRFWLPGANLTQRQIDACAARLSVTDACGLIESYPECSFQGQNANGTSCNDDAQCGSAHCVLHDGNCGTCEAPLALGDGCDGEVTGCGPGLFCSEATKTCTKRLEAGDSCWGRGAYWACDDGLGCVRDPDAEAATCQLLTPEGGPCSRYSPDEASTCSRGTVCIDDKCTARPTLKKVKAGEKCPFKGDGRMCAASLCNGDTLRCEPFVMPSSIGDLCE